MNDDLKELAKNLKLLSKEYETIQEVVLEARQKALIKCFHCGNCSFKEEEDE